MISFGTFLQCVDQNAARIHSYQSGHDGSDGTCDCIGLPIGAVRLAGEEWPWTHGSNYAARNRVRGLRLVSSVSDLALGELVFKSWEPGESGYDLPDTYRGHPDQRDYYHVGVVTGVSPLEITHCTKSGDKSGIFHDTKIGQWKWAGELNLVNYNREGSEDDVYPVYDAVVVASSGKTVRLRKEPSTNSKELAAVPIGTKVGVLGEYNSDWSRIEYNGQRGYMMAKFLKVLDEPQIDMVLVSRQKLQELKALAAPLSALLSYFDSALMGETENE